MMIELQATYLNMPPNKQGFGGVLAQFVDSEGAHCNVGAGAQLLTGVNS